MDDRPKKKVVFVFQQVLMKHILRETPADCLGLDFFSSSRWASVPNSTSRLNLVNYQAMSLLAGRYDVEFVCTNVIGQREASLFVEADFLVINQVASPGSREFVAKLMEWLRGVELKGKLIFGTEFSWFNELASERITQEIVDVAYFEHLLLRHTARTEAALYASPRCHEAVIQEFEIGLDAAMLKSDVAASDRRTISFVRAPEGRSTKNNSAIDRLVARIRSSAVLSGYVVKVIEPPYSSIDYWNLMAESAFFIFTSVGETFSYCLNDAKALGAVSFFPETMYYTVVGRSFAVDAYPRSGVRYSSDDDLISKIERLALAPDELDAQSARGRVFVEDMFSVEAISRNWDTIFSGGSLNKETLYLYDPRSVAGWSHVVAESGRVGARFAMPYLNSEVPSEAGQGLSWHDIESDLVMLRYYLTEEPDSTFSRTVIKDDSLFSAGKGAGAPHSVDEAARFLQLICRQHKISKVVLGRALESSVARSALDRVRCFAGLEANIKPVDVVCV